MGRTDILSNSLIGHSLVFKGSEESPLLAPRGVYLSRNKLFVADTAQNRLFIWDQLPVSEFQSPDIVIGQAKKSTTGRNASGHVTASTLFYPPGIWSDGQKLVLADAWNHRVLIWLTMPTYDGQPADVVVGQPDFDQNDPNVEGIGAPPNARSLYWPYGVSSDGQRLWIADTGNRRVLFFNEIPTRNFPTADEVIGKTNFMERDYDLNDTV